MSEIRQILLQFPSLRAFLAEYGARISTEGMLLRVESPPPAGSMVDVEVVVAEGMRLLRARGEILWQDPSRPDGGQQAAVRFRQLDDASRTLVFKIVEQRRREGAETFRLDDVPGPREARLRDLTVPAAMPTGQAAAADPPAEGSVFDLAAPPAPPAADLFDSSGRARPTATPEPTPEPPAATPEPPPEPPAATPAAGEGVAVPPPDESARPGRRPAPPVPLLAETEAAPFDLGPPPVPEAEPEVAAEPDLGPEPEIEADLSAPADLSELFGGDELEMAPAKGRTEAFPPSFVNEVEAELEAAGSSEADVGAYSEVDAGEPVAAGGAPPGMEMPEPGAEPEIELEGAPAGVPAEPETAAATSAEEGAAGGPAAAIQPPPAAPAEGDAEATLDSAEEVVLDLPAADEMVAPPPAEEDRETASEPDDEPTPARAAPFSAESLSAEASLRVADASAAEHGPETVEIPIVAPPSAPEPAAGVPPPVVEPSPADASAPPAVQPAAEPASAPIDDNLLSIPELNPDADAAQAAAPEPPADLPSSAQALRGAASRSRHVGTWLLIALLVAALGVAGYFLFGLMRGGDGSAAPQATRQASTPGAARPGRAAAPSPAATSDEVESPDSSSRAAADTPPTADAADARPEPAADAGDAQPEPSPVVTEPLPADAGVGQPATPLSGLNRITWSETDSETVLALIGDGEILRGQIDTVAIGGAQPRLVIKIAGVERAFQPAVLEVGTSQVRRVRTGLQAGGGLHVVVDLASPEVSMLDLAVRDTRIELRLGTG